MGKPCARKTHRWFLDDSGLIQDILKPGWCIGGAAQRSPIVVPCPEADTWILPGWQDFPWILVKAKEYSDLCLGLETAGDTAVIARPCGTWAGRFVDGRLGLVLWRNS